MHGSVMVADTDYCYMRVYASENYFCKNVQIYNVISYEKIIHNLLIIIYINYGTYTIIYYTFCSELI